ncbi:macrophage mannose receptor 1 [Drosophila grimshawi]|uniref:GH20936 n=1 Tax=Drosophila grimshawi TaxID=7222 RepID=B4J491_DROGR|nr:macrophage mannose receptor 1 [Drosophila grimshawi]EDW00571.1 GH20936 [Drosophila grimshawi]
MKSLGFALLGLLCCSVLGWADETTDGTTPPSSTTEEGTSDDENSFNYFNYKDTTYALSLDKRNWFDAQCYCASHGYTLANIPTPKIQMSIMKFIYSIDFSDLISLVLAPIWTSGTNRAAIKQYTWHSSGARVGYSNFRRNPQGEEYDCIAINGITGYWSNVNCTDSRYFLCEVKCPKVEA